MMELQQYFVLNFICTYILSKVFYWSIVDLWYYINFMTEHLHFHFSLACIEEGNGNPFQCSCLENLRDGGAWWAAIYRVAQSRTWLKRLSSSRSSILCRCVSFWLTSLCIIGSSFIHWKRKWQPTPVFLPGESQGRGGPCGLPSLDRTESDTTEVT